MTEDPNSTTTPSTPSTPSSDDHPYNPTLHVTFLGEHDVGIPTVHATLTFDWPAIEADEDPEDFKQAFGRFMADYFSAPDADLLVRYDFECEDCYVDHKGSPCPLQDYEWERKDTDATNPGCDHVWDVYIPEAGPAYEVCKFCGVEKNPPQRDQPVQRDSHVVPADASSADSSTTEHAIVVESAKSNGFPTNFYTGTCNCGFTGSLKADPHDAGQDALDQHPNPFVLIGVQINGVWFVPDHTRDLETADKATPGQLLWGER